VSHLLEQTNKLLLRTLL